MVRESQLAADVRRQHLWDVLWIAEQIKMARTALKVGDINLDTSATTGEFVFTVIAAVAQMERRIMLERQAIGIEAAKAKGRYKGRKPTVREQAETIAKLAEQGLAKREIADKMGCSIRSVFAVLAEAKPGDAAA